MLKLYPGDAVRYKSALMPKNPFLVFAVKHGTDDVMLVPIGGNQQAQVLAKADDLVFMAHSTERMAQAVFHLVGALQGTEDEQSIAFLSMLVELLDPDGNLRKVVELEIKKANGEAVEEQPTPQPLKSTLVAIGGK